MVKLKRTQTAGGVGSINALLSRARALALHLSRRRGAQPSRSALTCCCMSSPPTTTQSFKLMPAPSALNWSASWKASSLQVDAAGATAQ